MLYERKELLEKEIYNLKFTLGQLYLKIVLGNTSFQEGYEYDEKKARLSDLMLDLSILNAVIENEQRN